MTRGKKAMLCAIALMAGVALGASDYVVQKTKAEGTFGQDEYLLSLIERFDGSGGFMGLMFRKSSLVTAALPPAPEGWTAHVWSSVPYAGLLSAEQENARDRQLVYALPDLTFVDDLPHYEQRLLDAYYDDTGRVYLGERSYFDLQVTVDGFAIGSEAWQAYLDKKNGYFDQVNGRVYHTRTNGITWYERRGPVEMASDGGLPYQLRQFEADMGRVSLRLLARASGSDLAQFMRRLDLSALKAMNAQQPGTLDLKDNHFLSPEPFDPETDIVAALWGESATRGDPVRLAEQREERKRRLAQTSCGVMMDCGID